MGAVVVGNTPGTFQACFTFTTLGYDFLFDSNCTEPPSGTTITDWEWDFGDTNTSTSGPTVSHTYAASGSYLVKLRVKNDAGTWSMYYSTTVHVLEERYRWDASVVSSVTYTTGGGNHRLEWEDLIQAAVLDSGSVSTNLTLASPGGNINGRAALLTDSTGTGIHGTAHPACSGLNDAGPVSGFATMWAIACQSNSASTARFNCPIIRKDLQPISNGTVWNIIIENNATNDMRTTIIDVPQANASAEYVSGIDPLQPRVYVVVIDRTDHPNASTLLRRNGTTLDGPTSWSSGSSLDTADPLYLFNGPITAPRQYWGGALGEMRCYRSSGPIPLAAIQQVEQEMMAGWGII